jgi:hypothetical protein
MTKAGLLVDLVGVPDALLIAIEDTSPDELANQHRHVWRGLRQLSRDLPFGRCRISSNVKEDQGPLADQFVDWLRHKIPLGVERAY